MRRTVRTRGARASYCGPASTSYSGVAHSDNLSFQQLESILTRNVGIYDQDHLQGIFTKIGGTSEQNTPIATEEEFATCGAKVDELNLERLRLTYPYIQHDKIIQMYELCEKNIVRTMDNINFYSHINVAIQNAFHNIRNSAFHNWNTKHPGREDYESFAVAFVKASEQNVENVSASECLGQAAAMSPHFENLSNINLM